jgi:xanthine/CO dehydrogenase XdhC/CoxF family maturation factor
MMDGSLQSLLPMYEWARSNASPLVAATIVATRGSTYRKAGAQMLIAPDGCYDGVLSGGCLEGDIAGHAISVFETREPKMVQYQNEGDDDLLWGLGSGCEGGFDVWLTHLDPSTGWAPLGDLAGSLEQRVAAAYGLVLASSVSGLRPGMSFSSAKPVRNPGNARVVQFDEPQVSMFVASVQPAREVLLMGGGPDALPVVDLAGGLGWHVTVVDHRPAYVTEGRFPRARRVLLTTPAELSRAVDLSRFDAAVVMSHHLATDLAALDALANTPIPYVGLLGPSARSRRLLDDLGAAARLYGPRLRAPVGLKLGGRDPASIALAIVAEMQAFFHGKAAATSLGPQ